MVKTWNYKHSALGVQALKIHYYMYSGLNKLSRSDTEVCSCHLSKRPLLVHMRAVLGGLVFSPARMGHQKLDLTPRSVRLYNHYLAPTPIQHKITYIASAEFRDLQLYRNMILLLASF
jgi:hypothetical protein